MIKLTSANPGLQSHVSKLQRLEMAKKMLKNASSESAGAPGSSELASPMQGTDE